MLHFFLVLTKPTFFTVFSNTEYQGISGAHRVMAGRRPGRYRQEAGHNESHPEIQRLHCQKTIQNRKGHNTIADVSKIIFFLPHTFIRRIKLICRQSKNRERDL